MTTQSILVALTGASGSLYGQRFLQAAVRHFPEVHLIVSDAAADVIRHELGIDLDPGDFDPQALLGEVEGLAPVQCHHWADFSAPFASGSNPCDAVVIVPCTMGTVARIAHGLADNLITRAADVALKERKTLIVVPRETPLNVIHLRNLTALAEAGAVVLPAAPGFYHRPQTIEELVDAVVERILAHLGVPEEELRVKWGGEQV